MTEEALQAQGAAAVIAGGTHRADLAPLVAAVALGLVVRRLADAFLTGCGAQPKRRVARIKCGAVGAL